MAKKKRKTTGARQRYDLKNPTVSFRLTREQKERLDDYIEAKGISFADFIKEMLDVKEEEMNDVWGDGYETGQKEGYENGFNDSQKQTESFEIPFQCPRCGLASTMQVNRQDTA